MSGDKGSTGKEDSIAHKGPYINTEQGKTQVKDVQEEIKVILLTNNRPSIQSKVQFQVTQVQQEIKVILVSKDRPSIQTKVKCQVTKFQQEIMVLLLTNMFINTEQDKISGDKGPTGNKGFIAD